MKTIYDSVLKRLRMQDEVAVQGAYIAKGNLATYGDLPTGLTTEEIGWTYHIEGGSWAGYEFYWTGDDWESLGQICSNATITINQNGVLVGSFTLNQASDATIDIPGGGGSDPDSLIGVTLNGVAGTVANRVAALTLDTSGFATTSQLAQKQDVIDNNNKLSYAYLSNTPTIPSALADLTSDSTHRLVTDAEKASWAGKQDAITANNKLDYSLITNTPTIPVVNNGVLTLKQNGVTLGQFSANSATDLEVNIQGGGTSTPVTYQGDPVYSIVSGTGATMSYEQATGALTIGADIPVNVSDFNNDAGYITISDIPTDLSDYTNDVGYITSSDIPANVSAFSNDAGYITSSYVHDAVLSIYHGTTLVGTFSANASSNVTVTIPAGGGGSSIDTLSLAIPTPPEPGDAFHIVIQKKTQGSWTTVLDSSTQYSLCRYFTGTDFTQMTSEGIPGIYSGNAVEISVGSLLTEGDECRVKWTIAGDTSGTQDSDWEGFIWPSAPGHTASVPPLDFLPTSGGIVDGAILSTAGGYSQTIYTITASTTTYTLEVGKVYAHSPSSAPIYTLPAVSDPTATQDIVIIVAFSASALSVAFVDAGGTTIPMLRTPSISAGQTYAFACAYDPINTTWRIMPVQWEVEA